MTIAYLVLILGIPWILWFVGIVCSIPFFIIRDRVRETKAQQAQAAAACGKRHSRIVGQLKMYP